MISSDLERKIRTSSRQFILLISNALRFFCLPSKDKREMASRRNWLMLCRFKATTPVTNACL
jgi:hypothetical protein